MGTLGWEQGSVVPQQVKREKEGQELQHYTIMIFLYTHSTQTTSSFKREWISRGKVNKSMVFKGS